MNVATIHHPATYSLSNLPVADVAELRVPQLIALIRQLDRDIAELNDLFLGEESWVIGRKYWAKMQVINDQRAALARIMEEVL